MGIPRTLWEVKASNMNGYSLKTGYLLMLKHGLMGTFPALISQNEELFVCLDKKLLQKVWEKLPLREAALNELQLYTNSSIGFNVSVGDHTTPIRVLSEEDFIELCERENQPFKWAPGLINLKSSSKIKSPFDED